MNTAPRKLINELGVQKIKVVFHWIAWKNELATLGFQNITNSIKNSFVALIFYLFEHTVIAFLIRKWITKNEKIYLFSENLKISKCPLEPSKTWRMRASTIWNNMYLSAFPAFAVSLILYFQKLLFLKKVDLTVCYRDSKPWKRR
jgi:hypothetical protein